MTTEQEKKQARLIELIKQIPGTQNYVSIAGHLLDHGVDVTLPPEPQWKPGQWAKVLLNGALEWRLARRNAANDGWGVFPGGELWRDDDVAEVKPVVVLDAEDVRKLLLSVEATAPIAGPDVLRFFAERGVDVR